MIICAAIKMKYLDSNDEKQSVIICGYRHGNCHHTISKLDVCSVIEKLRGLLIIKIISLTVKKLIFTQEIVVNYLKPMFGIKKTIVNMNYTQKIYIKERTDEYGSKNIQRLCDSL